MTSTIESPSVVEDNIRVVATRISEEEACVQLIASGTEFLNITIAVGVVEEWVRKGGMAAEMLAIFVNANPANEVVRVLVPLLPKLTTLDPAFVDKVDAFKASVRDLVGKHSVLPA